jgi:transcriptional regulator with XRE-family HTH domain
MDRKTLQKEVGKRLMGIRESLKFKPSEMADKLNAYRSSYYNYESGATAPQLISLHKLGKDFGISLDWLILNRGSSQYSAMEEKKVESVKEAPKTAQEIFSSPEAEVNRLVEYMKRFPLLQHEVMVTFYKFIEENKKTVGEMN